MFADKIYTNMKVDVLEALLASAVLYGVGSYWFWVNKTIITWTANAVFGRFQRQGANNERRRIKIIEEVRRMEEEEEDEDEDLPAVQVINDDVGKKCD